MRLQAGEGQIETRGCVKENEMSQLVGADDAMVLHRQQTAAVNRRMDTQPFHEHCPSHHISAQLSVGHCSPFGKEDLNKLRNRNSWTVFEEYSCISHYGDWIAEAERLPVAQGFKSNQQQNQ